MKDIPQIAKELFGDNHPAQCKGGHIICLNCYQCHLNCPDQVYNPTQDLASVIDATVLKAETNKEDITELCKTANKYKNKLKIQPITRGKLQLGRFADRQVFRTLVTRCRGMTTLPPSSQPTFYRETVSSNRYM